MSVTSGPRTLKLHVHLDLIEGDVARSFDHDLDPGVPGPLDELAEGQQLFDLGPVGGVGDGSRPQPVAQADGDVMGPGQLQETVELLVERIFLSVVEDPGQVERAAAGYDVGDAALPAEPFDGLDRQAAMDGHEIDPLQGLGFHGGEHVVGGHGQDRSPALDRLDAGLINGHRPQRDRGSGQDPPADGGEIAAGAEIHQGVGAVGQADIDLGQLLFRGREVLGRAEIDVDLGPQGLADAHRPQAGMAGISRDDDAPVGQERQQILGPAVFGGSRRLQGFRNPAAAGLFHLGHANRPLSEIRRPAA
jgi:hypothetical protein